SRAICWSKRTLEILDRLGCGERLVRKGVGWNVGRVFFRDEQVYQFDLLPEPGHRRPAFINLQQYYVEQFLVERATELPEVDLRCCIARPTMFGASISSSAGTPIRKRKESRTGSSRVCARCSARMLDSKSSGRASTPSSAGACVRSVVAARCSSATRRT